MSTTTRVGATVRRIASAASLSAIALSSPPAFAGAAASPMASRSDAAPAKRGGAALPVDAPSNDGRRTGRRFVPNLGGNLAGVLSRDNLRPFLITAAATGAAAPFDDNVARYFSPDRRAKWLGDLGATIGKGYVIGPAAAALFGAGRLAGHGRFRDATYDIAQVTLVTAAYTTAIKYPTRRDRPDGSDRLSFPSGHTSNASAWATVASHHYGWRLGVPSYAFATLMGIARLEKNLHYLTDVVAAAGLGYVCGRTVIRRDGEPVAGRSPRVFLTPVFGAKGGGAGLMVSVGF
jgi:membrane-associated phospholipid phosphatase